MNSISEIMGKLDDKQLSQFYNEISVLTDDLGKTLIAKIGGPNSPISADELPLATFSKGETLNRLYRLEELGIFRSEMQKKGKGYVRSFIATDIAKRLAENLQTPTPTR